MNARPVRTRPAILLAIAALVPGFAIGQDEAPASAAEPVSQAEQLLFRQAHLATVRSPRTLVYAYTAQAAASASPPGRATLALALRTDGSCCVVHGEYLSGEMAVRLPDFEDATANPIVMYFLEGEVRRLQRTTTGQSAHFRRQIRMALATEARVTATSIRWNGQDVPAQAVHVAPFLDDPYRARFAREARTEYDFVLSDAVPGGVAALAATLPGDAGTAAPLESRRLVLEDPQPPSPARP